MKLTLSINMCPAGCNMEGQKHQFETEGGSFGRAADNNWVLPDPSRYVSSRHGRISFENNQFVLTDESTNGIFLNDGLQPLGANNRPILNDGDQLIFGDYRLQINIEMSANVTATPTAKVSATPSETLSNQSESPVFVDDLDKWLEPAAPVSVPSRSPQTSINILSSPSVKTHGDIDLGLKEEEKDPLALLGLGQQNKNVSSSALVSQTDSLTDLLGETPPLDQQMMKIPSVIPDDWDGLLGGGAPGIKTTQVDPDATYLDSASGPSSSGSPISEPATSGPLESLVPPVMPEPESAFSEPGVKTSADLGLSELLATPSEQLPSKSSTVLKTEAVGVSASKLTEPAPPSSNLAGVELAQALGLEQLSVEQKNILNDVVANTVKETVSGMMRTLRARSEIKSELRMNMTTIQSAENNPLKFSVTPEDALENMFAKQGKAYLSPTDAINDGFADISDHQVALFDAMKAAYEHILGQFDPGFLARKFEKTSSKSFLGGSKGKNWDAYLSLFDELKEDNEVTFKRLFGDVFADAYERRMHSLKMSRAHTSGNKPSK